MVVKSSVCLRRAVLSFLAVAAVTMSAQTGIAAKPGRKVKAVKSEPFEPVASAPDFAVWKKYVFRDRLALKTGKGEDGEYFLTVNGVLPKGDTTWNMVSPPIAIPEGAHEFVVSVEIKCEWAIRDHGKSGDKAENSITWFDAEHKKISSQGMPHMATGGSDGFERVREWGKIPEGARFCKIKYGFDSPNLKAGEVVTYRSFSFETVLAGSSRASEFEREWRENAWARKNFASRGAPVLYGDEPLPSKPDIPAVTLRDDGFTLVDGKPFFPIGVYNVKRGTCNSNSLDRAFADLKAAGFNFAQTYADAYEPEFMEAVRKHGMKLWVRARPGDTNFLNSGRSNPNILAWYLGDDSSRTVKPLVMRDRNASVKAADPFRITCQADSVKAREPMSNYAAYVPYSDVFMPEIYPVYGHAGDISDTTCVARTIMDMQRIAADVRQFNDGRPRGCWPIIQYFSGWNKWFHFPSREQLFAMTWASIVHGANGVVYYIYNGTSINKKTGLKNKGITETPETWRNISDLVAQLNEWMPVLLERTPKEQPKVEILEGPKRDPLDVDASVTCLYKVHEGKGRLIAVNATTEKVTARFRLPDGSVFTHSFGPFEVLLR